MRGIQTLIAALALTAAIPELASAKQVCSNAAAECRAVLPEPCRSNRAGAGSLPAETTGAAASCEAALSAYRDCLNRVVENCSADPVLSPPVALICVLALDTYIRRTDKRDHQQVTATVRVESDRLIFRNTGVVRPVTITATHFKSSFPFEVSFSKYLDFSIDRTNGRISGGKSIFYVRALSTADISLTGECKAPDHAAIEPRSGD